MVKLICILDVAPKSLEEEFEKYLPDFKTSLANVARQNRQIVLMLEDINEKLDFALNKRVEAESPANDMSEMETLYQKLCPANSVEEVIKIEKVLGGNEKFKSFMVSLCFSQPF